MGAWLKQNDFKDLTFFGQDWGGLIGLRMVAADPDRFLRVAVGNTGLPYNPDVDQEVIEKVHTFRASKKKYSIFKMWEEVSKMDKKSLSLEKGVKTHPALKFMWWQKWTWDTNDPAFGLVNSMQMERGSYIGRLIYYFFQRMGLSKIAPFKTDLIKAYEAPFPNPSYKMGPRAMPSQVPIIPDKSLEAQRVAREFFKTSDKPFLSVFAGNDPVTNGIEKDVLRMAPNAISAEKIGGGHFFQWTKAEKLSNILIQFIKEGK